MNFRTRAGAARRDRISTPNADESRRRRGPTRSALRTAGRSHSAPRAPCGSGMTVRCAQCHDHKYDPIKQKRFLSDPRLFQSIGGEADIDAPMPGELAALSSGRKAGLRRRRAELLISTRSPSCKKSGKRTSRRDGTSWQNLDWDFRSPRIRAANRSGGPIHAHEARNSAASRAGPAADLLRRAQRPGNRRRQKELVAKLKEAAHGTREPSTRS